MLLVALDVHDLVQWTNLAKWLFPGRIPLTRTTDDDPPGGVVVALSWTTSVWMTITSSEGCRKALCLVFTVTCSGILWVLSKVVYWGGTFSKLETAQRLRSCMEPALTSLGLLDWFFAWIITRFFLDWTWLSLFTSLVEQHVSGTKMGLLWAVCKESVEYHFMVVEHLVPTSMSSVLRVSLLCRFSRLLAFKWKGSQFRAVHEHTERTSSYEPFVSACWSSFWWQIMSPSNLTVWAAFWKKKITDFFSFLGKDLNTYDWELRPASFQFKGCAIMSKSCSSISD